MIHTYLERWYDSGLTPPEVASREELERREVERLSGALAIVLMAGTIPRRLGGDATDEDLALDRKRAKRAGYALSQALKGWTKKKPDLPLDDKVRMAGAQLDWDRWLQEHNAALENELRCLATWAVIHNEQRWGRSAVVKLENELNWITYSMRD